MRDELHGARGEADKLLSVQEVANILGTSRTSVRTWIHEKRLPALNAGRLLRIRRSDVDVFLASGGNTTPEPKVETEMDAILERRRHRVASVPAQSAA